MQDIFVQMVSGLKQADLQCLYSIISQSVSNTETSMVHYQKYLNWHKQLNMHQHLN